jgi:hypothetical protein
MAVSLTLVWLRRLAFGIAAAMLAGCASMATTPELAVRQRATEHWKARQASDYDKAYTFMPPSYRAVTPLETYKRGFGGAVQLKDAQVEQVVCETGDKCVATTRLEAKVVLARANTPPIVTYYEEVWVRENGQWWLFPTQ